MCLCVCLSLSLSLSRPLSLSTSLSLSLSLSVRAFQASCAGLLHSGLGADNLPHVIQLPALPLACTQNNRYRKQMIEWGEAKRNADPGFFCRLATKDATAPIWIVTDARRPSDVAYFKVRGAFFGCVGCQTNKWPWVNGERKNQNG